MQLEAKQAKYAWTEQKNLTLFNLTSTDPLL